MCNLETSTVTPSSDFVKRSTHVTSVELLVCIVESCIFLNLIAFDKTLKNPEIIPILSPVILYDTKLRYFLCCYVEIEPYIFISEWY